MGKNEHEPDQQQPSDKPLSSVDFSALYKEQHSDAIENTDKARMEAVEGAYNEEYAVEDRNLARESGKRAQVPGLSSNKRLVEIETAERHLREANRYQEDAGRKEDAAGTDFDRAQAVVDQTKPRSEQQ